MSSPSRTPRKFEYTPAVRTAVPLIIGLNGPSSSGKTFSALRLATGIQKIVGGDIAGIDTEANRMKHYADKFRFNHVPFGAPFSPLDYLEVIKFAVDKGARTIVIDSCSHLHDGPGGILEMHAAEMEAQRERRRDRSSSDEDDGGPNSFAAWAKPKAQLRQFINELITGLGRPGLVLNLILCFRAKDKLKLPRGSKKVIELGLQPIADPELRYEMTTNILLYDGARGVPTWQSPTPGEMNVIKLPDAFVEMFGARSQLDEAAGEKMARWSNGGSAPGATVDPKHAANVASWIEFWGKRNITPERVLATLGKTSIDHVDAMDLRVFDGFVKQLKAKEKTSEQLFASSAPPPDEPEEDEEEANRRAAEPTAEEIAAMDAEKTNGAGAGKVA